MGKIFAAIIDIFKSITMSNEMDSKSETEKNMEQLNLKVIGQDGQAVQFKIKRGTPFRKVGYSVT